MPLLLSMALPLLACLTLVGTTSVLWWDTLQRPWVFAIVGFLAMLGVHRIVQVMFEVLELLPVGRGYFVVVRNEPNLAQLARGSLNIKSMLVTALVIVVGFPLLAWVKGSLART